MEKFDSMLSPVIDSTLGQRCSSIFGYQFSEIVRSLMSVYFCGGSCVEDVTSQLMRHLSYHPTLRTCSSDTILRAIIPVQVRGNNPTSVSAESRAARIRGNGSFPIQSVAQTREACCLPVVPIRKRSL